MPRVHVEPGGHEFEATTGDTVMGAALAAGYRWPTVCGGEGTCRTCALRLVTGTLGPVSAWEDEGLRESGLIHTGPAGVVRLACQARVEDEDVVVHKPGVRPS